MCGNYTLDRLLSKDLYVPVENRCEYLLINGNLSKYRFDVIWYTGH